MKAPFVFGGISCFILLLISNYLENATFTTVAIFILFALLIFLIIFRKYIKNFISLFIACICCFSACFSFLIQQESYIPFSKLENEKVKITGTVCSFAQEYTGYSSYEVITEFKNTKGKIMIYDYSESPPSLNQTITAAVSFSKRDTAYRLNDKSKGIYAVGKIYKNTLLEENNSKGINYYTALLRQRIKEIIEKYVDSEHKGIALSVSTGDKSMLEIYEDNAFICTGLAHMNSVSGTHFVYVTGFLLFVCYLFGVNPKITAAAALAMGIFICIAANFTPSVIRSFIICAISVMSAVFKKEPFSLNSLCIAIVVILLSNPFACGGLSFTLSALACFGMITCCVPLSRFIKTKFMPDIKNKVFVSVVNMICACAAATVFTLPIYALNFDYVSFTGFISNPLVVPVAAFLPFIVFCLLLLSFCPPLASLLGYVIGHLCDYIFAVTDIVSRFDLGYFYANKPYIYLTSVILMVFLLICYLFNLDKIRFAGVVSIAAVFCVCFVSSYYLTDFKAAMSNKLEIREIEGTQSTLISKGNCGVLFDCGGDSASRKITLQLENEGVSELKAIIISDNDINCYNALEDIIRYNRPEAVIIPESMKPFSKRIQDITALCISLGIDVIIADKDIALSLTKNTKISIFADNMLKNGGALTVEIEEKNEKILISGNNCISNKEN